MSKLTPCMTATRLCAVLSEHPLRTISPELLHRGADPIRIEDLSRPWLSRRREQDELHPLGGALLVPLQGVHDRVDSDLRVKCARQVMAGQDRLDLRGEVGCV